MTTRAGPQDLPWLSPRSIKGQPRPFPDGHFLTVPWNYGIFRLKLMHCAKFLQRLSELVPIWKYQKQRPGRVFAGSPQQRYSQEVLYAG